ncbi:hypothetical protein GCM10010172_10520 [Paractinoplanes ferrugineus]|uniref:Uncharacterized protein n=1 Tax=Paractinoplanes ferrugineus TaxID=113564 RepID=A0A919M7N9_9ACTN|nr:hypothetical protein [Actinoplanes ferrugineus]GIE09616.1 hypothetical protein Afe05nite_14560 [Actinoplanes ferrugineus]
MLTDRDRTLLAPHLPLLRKARAELTAARQALTEAEQQVGESRTGTDWRDRTFGGLFSVDEGRARRFRAARRAHKAAQSSVEAAAKRYVKYSVRIDELLEPLLSRDDLAFRELLAALKECDKALRSVESMRDHIRSALTKPSQNARRTNAAKESDTWHEAEFARRRFDELVAEVQQSVPRLRRVLSQTARAVAETTGGRPPTVPHLDSSLLNRRGRAAEQPLRALQRRLETVVQEVAGWRTQVDAARKAALRAAEESL